MKTQNFFDEADYFDEKKEILDDRAKTSLQLIRKAKKNILLNKVLDVGCGTGFFSSKIKEVARAEVYGIDFSKKALKHAKGYGIKTKRADLNSRIPFNNSEFDMVNCGEVIEHMYNPDNLLREIHRVLKPDGYLLITTPNLASWYNRIALLLGIQPFFTEISTENKRLGYSFLKRFVDNGKPIGHVRIITLKGLKDLLKFHNFKVIEVRGAYVPFRYIRFFDRFFRNFPSLSSVLIILAKK